MGRITINYYEMDFSSGVLRYEFSGIALGFIFQTSAVIHIVHAIIYPFNLIPRLPSLFRELLEVFCCTYCSIPLALTMYWLMFG